MNRRTCYFAGRVQGVGFRYTTQNIAMQFNVRGYVRNTADGRVELVMEGPDDQMDGVIASLQSRMGEYIKSVNMHSSPATGEFEQFSVRG
ncbi:MAG TPA: acylphosphatase [Tepidisphaeraceae bacterium]|nr:acylphosphatase [Tepidisphaeraceae bacterium]